MRLATVLLPLLLLPGCLMFEEQVVTGVYDAAADRLTLHIVYLGLHGKGDGTVAKFTQAVENNHVCLIDWPFSYEPEEAAQSDNPFVRFVAKNVSIRRVGFFKDAQGRLSGGQIVVIDHVREVFKQFNTSLTAEALPDALEDADPETQALNRAAASNGHAWLRLRGQALEFVFFASDHDYERLKRAFLEGFDPGSAEAQARREWLVRNPWSFLREGKKVHIILGNPEGPLRLVTPARGRDPYTPVLEACVAKRWGYHLDSVVAPLLLHPPKPMPPERLRALIEQIEAADPRRADAAARELGKAEADLAAIEAQVERLSPEGRRRIAGVIAELKHPRRAFARFLPRAERVRILLAQPASDDVTAALRAEIARLPFPPEQPPADPAAFLRGWLADWVAQQRAARQPESKDEGGEKDEGD